MIPGYGSLPYGLYPYGDPAAAGLPTLQVLLDDGTGTFPFDITSKVRMPQGWSATRGRQDEQADVQAGTLDLVLNNTDGRFTHGSTVLASPSPIKVDQRIRVIETANGVAVTRFTGYVQSWPVEWPGGQSLSLAQIRAADVLARAERRALSSVIEEQTLPLDPDAYWLMGDPSGVTQAASALSGGTPLSIVGTGADVAFGTAVGPETAGVTAVQFAGGKYLRAFVSIPIDTTTTPFWLAVSFTTAAMTGADPSRVLAAFVGDLNAIGIYQTVGEVRVWGGGASVGKVAGVLGSASTMTAGRFDDGQMHTVFLYGDAANTKLYVDGVLQATSAAAALTGTIQIFTAGESASTEGVPHIGTAAQLACGRGTLTADQIAAMHTSRSTGFSGETAGARITRLASYAPAIPVGAIDSGSPVAYLDFTGRSQADEMRNVAAAELGILDVDGDGGLDFTSRTTIAGKATPDLTLPASWLERDLQPVVDNQQIVNFFDASTVTGESARTRNEASEVAHGRYADSKQYLLDDVEDVRARGEWIVANYAEPSPRIGSMTIDLLTRTPAEQAQVLALKPGAWVRVTGLPSQWPGGTTADLVVQGWTESQSVSAWTLTCNVVSRSLYTAWLLQDSTYGVLGTTTKLYV